MKFTLFFSAFVLACLLTLFPSQQLIAQDAPNKDAASERVIEGPSLEIMETQIDLGTIAPET
ncbi:MAG: hypothetical protein ACYSPI_04470, partial [Planctomycetota bacterium]